VTSYRDAGVDLQAADDLVGEIAGIVRSTWNDEVVGTFGSFAAGIRVPADYRRPVLMMTTDGVGTKLELARRTGRLDGVGFDLVAMCVDDLAAVGAAPLGFTDYLAVGRIDRARDRRIVESIAAACREAGCPLLGGETAEHPGVMADDQFDLAGAAMGIVEEDRQINGSAIEPGDVVLGLASPNARANGFSLIRAVLGDFDLANELPGTGRSATDVLLEPSVIYSPALVRARAATEVHGLAHVTGGGIGGNLERVLPEGRRAVIEWGSWPVPDVFRAIQSLGSIPDREMLGVFNLGIGFVVVAATGALDALAGLLAPHDVLEIGRIVEGPPGVDFT
jgi:phosphoribosylformylglycinamidine cyclo-ligase